MTRKHDRDGRLGWPDGWAVSSANESAPPAFTSLTDTLSDARRSASDLMLVAQACPAARLSTVILFNVPAFRCASVADKVSGSLNIAPKRCSPL